MQIVAIGAFISSFLYFMPIFFKYLADQFHFSILVATSFTLINSILTVIFSLLSISLVKKFGFHIISIVGLIITSVGAFLIFPVSGIKNKLDCMIIGLVLIGIGNGLGPGVSCMLIKLYLKENLPEIQEIQINDFVGIAFSYGLFGSQFLSGIIGGVISEYISYSAASIVFAVLIFIVFIVFLILFLDRVKRELQNEHFDIEKEDSQKSQIYDEKISLNKDKSKQDGENENEENSLLIVK